MEEEYKYAAAIQVLEGLEAVRKRPGMYVGNVRDGWALRHMVWEVVDSSLDEHLAGFGARIEVTLEEDGSVSVRDEGRGIPVEVIPERGVPLAEVVLTKLHAGGRFDNRTYSVRAGAHGVGVSAVNALSEWLEVTIHRDGRVWRQRHERGLPRGPLVAGEATARTGTTLRWKPDLTIFQDVTRVTPAMVRPRLRELAALFPRLTLALRSAEREEIFHTPSGLSGLVAGSCVGRETLLPAAAHFSAGEALAGGGVMSAEVALQWLAEPAPDTERAMLAESFVNGNRTAEGGAHVVGLRGGVRQAVRELARRAGLLDRRTWNKLATHLIDRTMFAVHIRHPRPEYGARTKDLLRNPEVVALVRRATRAKGMALLVEHPGLLEALLRPPVG